MTDPKKTPQDEQDRDAPQESGQADYGSAGQQALEGVNGAKGEDRKD